MKNQNLREKIRDRLLRWNGFEVKQEVDFILSVFSEEIKENMKCLCKKNHNWDKSENPVECRDCPMTLPYWYALSDLLEKIKF